MPKIKTVDDYISSFDDEVKVRLIHLRQLILKAAPKTTEMISYNMPLYKLNGMLISFAAWKHHIGLYPTPKAVGVLKKKLKPYEGAKSTLRFPYKDSLPISLITEVIKLRVKENLSKAKK